MLTNSLGKPAVIWDYSAIFGSEFFNQFFVYSSDRNCSPPEETHCGKTHYGKIHQMGFGIPHPGSWLQGSLETLFW
jgi:hypothetical protein